MPIRAAIAIGEARYWPFVMLKRIVKKKSALFLAPLTFLLMGTSCDRHFDYSDCTINDQYLIDCWPDEPDRPFTDVKAQ